MKVLIINFNRLTLMRNLADWCAANGLEVIIVDNNSDYQPLLDYYATCPYQVERLPINYGHTVLWQNGLLQKLINNERYIVTDSDLDLSKVPNDFMQVLHNGLDLFPEFPKCGLSLEIDDLPDNKGTQEMKNKCEARYWTKPLNDLYFDAPVDTTFALYRETTLHYCIEAIRTNRPYTASHVPWYYTDINLLPEDEQNYYRTANASASGKHRILK
jgi:glycosyltransferase involved in cell wall biosynthesis